MSSKPPISLGKIPSVKELCEHLGFQHASLKDTNNFMEDTRAWRKSFQTSSGQPAATLLQWNDLSVQQDLEEMAQQFLNHANNGDRFWSPHRSWMQDSRMRFPEDRDDIVSLLKQVFWRQNRYAKNNSHYAQKNAGVRDGSRETITPDPRIEGYGHVKTLPPPTDTKAPIVSRDSIKSKPESIPIKTPKRSHHSSRSMIGDIFDGPNDSDSDDEVIIVSERESSIQKRPLPNDTNKSPPPKKKYHRPTSPRRTPRTLTTRQIPGKIPDNQVERLLTLTDEEPENPRRAYGSKSLPSASKTSGETTVKFKTPPNIAQSSDLVGVQMAAVAPPHTFEESVAILFHISGRSNAKPPRCCFLRKTQLRQILLKKKSIVPSAPKQNAESRPKLLRSLEPKLPTETEKTTRSSKKLPEETASPCPKTSQRPKIQSQTPQISKLKSSAREPPDIITTSTIPTIGAQQNPTLKERALPPRKTTHDPPAPPRLKPQLQETEPMAQMNQKLKSTPVPTMQKAIPLTGMERPVSTRESNQLLETASAKPKPTIEEEELPSSQQKRHDSPPVSNPTRNSTSQAQTVSSKPRQKTLIPLWIITREPRSSEELWDEGKFMGTTLAAFIEGISGVTQRDHIEKIKLTLRAPKFDTKITVLKEADDAWALAKETFTEKVREAKTEARLRRQPDQPFKILIEPIYEEGNSSTGNVEDEEDDFEF